MIEKAHCKIKQLLQITLGYWLLLLVMFFLLRFLGVDLLEDLPGTQGSIAGFLVILAVVTSLWLPALAFWRLSKFQLELFHLNSRTREKLEYGFACCDRVGDVYFTDVGLVIHQCRWGAKIQFEFIPYQDIKDLCIRREMEEEQALEIVRRKQPPCFIPMKIFLSAEDIARMQLKMRGLQKGAFSICPDEKRKKGLIEQEKLYDRNQKKNPFLRLILLSFFCLFIYVLGMLGILSLPAFVQKNFSHSPYVKAHVDVWPNVLFLLWTISIETALLWFGLPFMKKSPNCLAAWRLYIKSIAFYFFVIGFILFLAIFYGEDQSIGKLLTGGLKMFFMAMG